MRHQNACAVDGLEKAEEVPITVNVAIDRSHTFDVKAPADEVFAVLADVPRSARFFPRVHKLVDLEHNVYRWEMEKIGVAQINLQTVYACKYVSSKAKGTVIWTPVKGEGNAQVSGSWKISAAKKSTRLAFKVKGVITIPLPGMMQMLIAPIVENGFEQLIEKYIRNLTQHFGKV